MTNVISKTNTAMKYSFLFKGSQQIVALVMGIILARILSPDEFGIIAIVNMIIYYANSFTNFGLNNALIQKNNIDRDHIDTVFTIDLAISTFLAILTFFSSDYIGLYFHSQAVGDVLKWMSLYYIITAFYHIPIVILRRNIDFKLMSIVEFVEAVMTSIVAIYLALNGYSYWSIVIASLVVQAVAAIILIVKTRWIPRLVLGDDMGEIYSFGLWSFIRSQFDLLVAKIDYFVIGRYLGIYNLGLYEKSFELTNRAMSGISMPLNGVFYSTFSRVKNDVDKVRQIFNQALSLVTLVCYPVLLGLFSVAPHFVISCLGANWEPIIAPMQMLALACMFRVLVGMVANINVVMGHYKMHTLLNVSTSLLFVVFCFVFVPYGIHAISIVYLFYCISSFLLSFSLTRRKINVSYISLISSIWCPLIGSLIMLSSVMLLSKYVLTDRNSFLHLFGLVAVGASIYSAWCYLFLRKGIISFSIKEL